CQRGRLRCLRGETRPERKQTAIFHLPGWSGQRWGRRDRGRRCRERLRRRQCELRDRLPWHTERPRSVRHRGQQTESAGRVDLLLLPPVWRRRRDRRGCGRQCLRQCIVVIFESGHCHAGLWSGRHGPCHGLQDLSRRFEEDLRNHAGRQRSGGRNGDRGEQRGEVYVAGSTSSVDFPLAHPLQGTPGARPLWKSTDSGTTWTPIDDLPFALVQALVVDPSNPNTLYAATADLGVFKSVDGGVKWTSSSTGIAGTNIQTLAIDPTNPRTLYAATALALADAASP